MKNKNLVLFKQLCRWFVLFRKEKRNKERERERRRRAKKRKE
jgi:hypothetical protein